MKIDNVIIATDMSESSNVAAQWGMAYAKKLGIEVVIAHVIEVSVGGWLKGTFDILEDNEKVEYAKNQLREWCIRVTGSAPDAIEIRAGGTLPQLKSIVNDSPGQPVLVIAQSGLGKIAKFILGSTAQRLAAQPPCPLVIVHPSHTVIEENGKVLFGTDFSKNANIALDFAKTFCRSTNSELFITHGHQAPVIGSIFDAGGETFVHLQESVREIAESNLNDLIESQDLNGITYSTAIIQDDPSTVILTLAETENADLIVVGHSGESPLVQNILGSVAHRVLGKMPTTLVIIPDLDIK